MREFTEMTSEAAILGMIFLRWEYSTLSIHNPMKSKNVARLMQLELIF